jgi:histidinol phosphatase-like enzyme (inositol monophosphatase family)
MEKGDDTPVTQADRGAEEVIRKLIKEHYPEHGIIGEEYGSEREEAEYVWVLDPVDGTFSFTYGIPLFGTLICLKREGRPILGAINQPVTRECVIGDETVTTLNGKPVRCSAVSSLDRALLLTTDTRRPAALQPHTRFDRLAEKCRLLRTWGDAYGYLMVAAGRAEIMVDPIVNEWDFIGHVPIMRGAGARITDWDGNDPVGASSVICANAALYDDVMDVLHGRKE